ncbi:MAG: LysE/ArgO family amino acid transporter [Kiloniellaceae bacterium]
MHQLLIFLKGVAVGLAIAAPVGPVGILCIRRTLHQGAPVGLASGLGAACADALYGAVAGFGLTSVASFLLAFQGTLRLLGGAFLAVLGVRILARPAAGDEPAAAPAQARLAGAFGSCFLLTLTNPATILSFVAVFAGLGLVEHLAGYAAALSLVAGVFAGSALWWFALSGAVGLLRGRMSAPSLRWVNRIAGAVILGFGLAVLGFAALA